MSSFNVNYVVHVALTTLVAVLVFFVASFVLGSLFPEYTPLVLHSVKTLTKAAADLGSGLYN